MAATTEELLEALRASVKETQRLRGQALKRREPIAIVGMGLRLPGGATDLPSFWQVLERGVDTIGPIPTGRWDTRAFHDANPDAKGKSYVGQAAFLEDVEHFDAAFFGISPREARYIDPQHRMLLEASWESLERARIRPASLRNTPVGVFVGIIGSEYRDLRTEAFADEAYAITGTLASFAAGRLAFTLGLQGPAVSVESACSSALVGLHLACEALRREECDLALAGGVQLILSPAPFVLMCRNRALAPDGRCKTFSANADGYGRGEGVVVAALERLSDAQRNRHPVLAVIRGSAVNHDGPAASISAPNGSSQEKLLRAALESAGLTPDDIDYVECHGTGTALGDPIEVNALSAVYGRRTSGRPLPIGAVKPNIGHLEAAAGGAGLAKVVAALLEEKLPPTLHTEPRNPLLDWDALGVDVVDGLRPFPRTERPRRVGVSSFGMSGTNAHLILEEAPAEPLVPVRDDASLAPPHGDFPFVVSGKSEAAVSGQARRLLSHLRDRPELALADVAASLRTTRSSFDHRAVVFAQTREQLLPLLEELADGRTAPSTAVGRAGTKGKVVFCFPGQGAQFDGMGRALFASSPVFRAAIEACAAALEPHVDWSLLEVLRGDPAGASLDGVDVVQPVLFSIMVALAAVWRSLGVEPEAVVGHSQGEIAAAHVAGCLSLEDAARIVALRSRLLSRLSGQGAIASVGLGVAELDEHLRSFGGRLAVAATNSRTTSLVTGEPAAVDALVERLGREQVFARRIQSTIASHCRQVEALRADLIAGLASVRPRPGSIPFTSSVTGTSASGSELGAEYWYQNLREPVRFLDANAQLLASDHRFFVEVSPHPVLGLAMRENAEAAAARSVVVGSVRRDQPSMTRLLVSLGELHANGLDVDLGSLVPSSARLISLPTYAFDRERHWIEPGDDAEVDVDAAGLGRADHPFLGAALTLTEGDVVWTGRLSLEGNRWLADHVVFGTVVLPGTALLDLALFAGRSVGAPLVEELTIEAPLVIPAEGSVDLQVRLAPERSGRTRALAIHARPSVKVDGEEPATFTRHASGTVSPGATEIPAHVAAPLDVWPPSGASPIPLDDLYDRLRGRGLAYGPAFQNLRAAWQREGELFVELELSKESGVDRPGKRRFDLHPALHDSALHALFLAPAQAITEASVPFSWSGVSVRTPGAERLRVRLSSLSGHPSLAFFDAESEPVGHIGALAVRPLSAEQLRSSATRSVLRHLYELGWTPAAGGGAPAPAKTPRVASCTTVAELERRLGGDEPPPEVVVLRCQGEPQAAFPRARQAHDAIHRVAAFVRAFVGEPRLEEAALVVVTERAVATSRDEDVLDLEAAPLWGFLRSVQSEYPERTIVLLDADATATLAEIQAAAGAGEPQLALRSGTPLVPRLARHRDTGETAAFPSLRDGTVLITGGTGGLGSTIARHLVVSHGVRHLVLTSRTGRADALHAELRELGAQVKVVACDVADRSALAGVIAEVPPAHPLRGVIHTAGVLEDGVLAGLTGDQIDRVLRPKIDGAFHLDELTAGCDLSLFVLFSSIASVFGSAGQSSYAAANAALDALAQHRRARGLAGLSIAWGPFLGVGLLAGMSAVNWERIRRGGMGSLSPSQGLLLFDAALAQQAAPCVAAMPLDAAAMARADAVPVVARTLVEPFVPQQKSSGGKLKRKVLALPVERRRRALLDAVRAHAAAVLGVAQSIDPESALVGLGLDSLMAIELRNRLRSELELALPATLLFDHPTPSALARYLEGKIEDGPVGASSPSPSVGPAVTGDDPIAIVSIACHFPSGIRTPEALWQLLEAGGDAISPFPVNRGWDLDALYSADAGAHGKTYAREGGFLHDAGAFDAGFFGISPREALTIDPQHRLLLETTWNAIERAGIVPASLAGSPTGVFVGLMYSDYGARFLGSPSVFEGNIGTGSSPSIASGRIAYTFGFHGPALTVDTACSSSLVALDLACHSLRRGECSLAIAGGATVMATPAAFIEFSRQGGLAPDGRCKSFSARANGAGWSEGVAALVLERLEDARRNGHPVLAVIRGTAVNQDGKSQGLTAPSGPAQEQVIQRALQRSRVRAADVDVVEAHGTGTTLGDPIEAGALLATYGQAHSAADPLWLGSLKSNLGHTQAAAGLAGVVKMVLAMKHGVLPRTLHADEPSPHVDWSSGAVRLLTEARPWWRRGHPRRAAVSSFGISGTNAHIVVEEPPEGPAEATAPAAPAHVLPFVLSAKSERALAAQAAALRAHLDEASEATLVDVAWSLATTRTAFEHRAVIVANERAELAASLAAIASGAPDARCITHRARDMRLGFLFTGQGAQRPTMGRGLHEASASLPAFRDALDACFAGFDGKLSASLREVMFAAEGSADAALLDQTQLTQAALFAFEVALFRTFESWGITPDLLLGHSIGEVVAAHVAGVLSLEDACHLVAARGRLMQAISTPGAMIALQATEAEVRAVLAELPEGGVDIAAVNGPTATVVSGDPEAVQDVALDFIARGRKATRLNVSHAFHSSHVDPMLEDFRQTVQALSLSPPRIPIVSNVTGRIALDAELTSPEYWVRHVRASVRFAEGVRVAESAGTTAFLELGPQGILSALARDSVLREDEVLFVPASRGERDEVTSLFAAVGAIHAAGGAVDWPAVLGPLRGRPVALPTYAFQRERYWLDVEARTTAPVLAQTGHPILDTELVLADGSVVWTGTLSLVREPWLADHALFGRILVPGSVWVDLACFAGRAVGRETIDELTIEAPVVLFPGHDVDVQLKVGPVLASGERAFTLSSRGTEDGSDEADSSWTENVVGRLRAAGPSDLVTVDLATWPAPAAEPLDLAGFYPSLEDVGLSYGAAFRGLSAVWRRNDEIFAEVEMPPLAPSTARGSRFAIHPILLDVALHALLRVQPPRAEAIEVPFSLSGVTLRAAASQRLRVHLAPSSEGTRIALASPEGETLGVFAALRARPLPASALQALAVRSRVHDLYEHAFVPMEMEAAATATQLRSVTIGAAGFADPRSLLRALDDGAASPEAVVFACADSGGDPSPSVVADTHALVHRVAAGLQDLLAEPRLADAAFVVVTRQATAVAAHEDVSDLAASALWGLVRAVQLEHPDRKLALLDLDADTSEAEAGVAVATAVAAGHRQVALRREGVFVSLGLARPSAVRLEVPSSESWHLDVRGRGNLDGLVLTADPSPSAGLAEGEIRIQVRAAGLNFRDVLNVLGMYPGAPPIPGGEGAGIVVGVGPGVTRFVPGDAVMGIFQRAFGPTAVADQRLVVRIPRGVSMLSAAALPVVFLTAYYALVDLARLAPGERLLVHAAAGGVGMAAVQLARHLGAEVFGTASPSKWSVLKRMGLDDAHLASSRDLAFETHFAKDGRRLDVVLNSLTDDFVDASMRVLSSGGRFLEMGKRDVRPAREVATRHPGIAYRPFDLMDAKIERLTEMLEAVADLFDRGVLTPLPVTSFDVRDATAAFRFVSQARHVGKVVLTLPRPSLAGGTVLVTGGTTGLGAVVAEHLVVRHHVRHLLLCSRTGNAPLLKAKLEAVGAEVRIAKCDVSDAAALEALLASVDPARPLSGVVHAAGVLEDVAFTSLTPAAIDRVLAPKVDAALHLHRLTRDLDLSAFVLFSSLAGVIGSAGQANYGAANAFLDALAHHRNARGLPGLSIAWGGWGEAGMVTRLSAGARERMARKGLRFLTTSEGLTLFDLALAGSSPLAIAARIQDAEAETKDTSDLFGHGAPSAEAVEDAIVRTVRRALFLPETSVVERDLPLSRLGLDSLIAIELRSSLGRLLGASLPPTLLFDHPTLEALVGYVMTEIAPARSRATPGPPAPSAPSTEASNGTANGGSTHHALERELSVADVLSAIERLSAEDQEELMQNLLGTSPS